MPKAKTALFDNHIERGPVMARKRYTNQKKANIVDFITSHDSAHGRGGIAAARKKYRVSRLTLARWLKLSRRRPSAGGNTVTAAVKDGSLASRLERMATIQREMEKLQKEYGTLRARL